MLMESPTATTATMSTIRDFFIRAPRLNKSKQVTNPESQTFDEPLTSSSPSKPLRSLLTVDLTQDDNEKVEESVSPAPQMDTSPMRSPVRSVRDKRPEPSAPAQSFESIPLPSSLNGSFKGSQRILKGGKEVVISSDGEDTDSASDLEDPDVLFALDSKPKKAAPPPPKRYQPNKSLLAQLAKPKKYKYTIDALVHDAVDDNEVEANVTKAKATFEHLQQTGTDGGGGGSTKGLNEGMLASALGDNTDEGPGLQRLMDAVRRTEALEQNRTWRFLDDGQMTPATPNFPIELFPPRSDLAGLRGCSIHI